ncbi:MAG: lysostaphin resistance A-like protein [Eubacteriales bacterium]
MERSKVQRLLGVMMPFVIMVIFQRLAGLLVSELPLPEPMGSLLAFLCASAAGIFFLRISCGRNALCLSRPSDAPPDSDGEEDDAHIPPFPARDTILGQTLYALTCLAGLIVVMYLVTAMADAETAEVPEEGWLAVEFVSLVLLHPLVEEYVFRWVCYRELRPMQPIFAGLAQAVMFAIVHSTVGGMIYAIFAGILLALILEYSGSLAAPTAAHMLVNLRSFVFLTWLADGAAENAARIRTAVDFALVSVGFAAFLILLIRRGLRDIADLPEADSGIVGADASKEDDDDGN